MVLGESTVSLKTNTLLFAADIGVLVGKKELFWEIELDFGANTLLFGVKYCGILGK